MIVEILTLNLKPGVRHQFQELYIKECLPLLKKWKMNVVAHGPSYHDDHSYYVIRAFKNLEERQQMEDEYYSSDDWRNGPRNAVLSMLASDATVVVPMEAVETWLNIIDEG